MTGRPSGRGAWPLALVAAWLLSGPRAAIGAPGEAPGPRAPGAPRPRLALVLSGGGARGAAHVGVLKVLEELHVPDDLVVGTSMGSIVGGLYAAGYTPDEIEGILASVNWKELFIDHAEREDKTFRRKQDDATFLIPTRLRFRGWKPYLPPAILGGQRLELLLRSLEIQATGEHDFDRLPIPFRAVAADLTSGEAVVLDHGSLATSMRASMSVPGAFAPVEIDGRLLVDGGSAANLPVGIAQRLGAERIIAVDITSPLYTKEELGSVFSIVGQMSSFVTYGNRLEDLKRLRSGDVLIQPDLGDMTFTDFDRADEAVHAGEAAARARAGDLRGLAVDDAAWETFRAGHTRRPWSDLVVDQVRLENGSWVADQVVQERLKVETGTWFDSQALRENMLRLHALDYFGLIRHDFERRDGVGTLSIETPKKPYGRNSLQFGLSFRDDFEGENSWSMALRHLVLAADRRGGEWENTMQIGDTALVRSEFYQPFDFGMRWFVAPWGQVRRESLTLWEDGQAVSESRIDRNEAHVDFGRVFGDWGEVRLGPFYAYEKGDVRIGPPSVEPYQEHTGGGRFLFRVDTRDASVFPRRGAEVAALYQQSFASWGSDADSQRAWLLAGVAMTAGRVTILPSVEGGTLITGPSTLDSQVRLGGFLRLSGLGQDELLGDRGGLARVLAYVQLRRFDLGALSSTVYGGLSLETGNVYAQGDPISWGSLRHGGSVFLGAQTVLGPVFLGYGVSDGGRDRVYLIIGHRF